MSKTDLIGSGCTLIAGAIAYLVSGPTAAILSFVVGVMLIVVAHLRTAEEEPPVTLGARWDTASDIPNNQSRDYESREQIGAADWKELASQFKRVSHGVSADWYQTIKAQSRAIIEDNWYVRGNGRAECEALCKNAGAMLLRSPQILPTLSDRVRSQSDHVERWLYFLKELGRTKVAGVGYGTIRDTKTVNSFESIDDLALVSATVGMECSADEI